MSTRSTFEGMFFNKDFGARKCRLRIDWGNGKSIVFRLDRAVRVVGPCRAYITKTLVVDKTGPFLFRNVLDGSEWILTRINPHG